MFISQVTEDIKNKVGDALKEKPDFMPSFLAQKLGISEAVVLAALPEDMRSFARAEEFEKVWAELCKWEKATFFVNSPGKRPFLSTVRERLLSIKASCRKENTVMVFLI